MTKYVRPYLGKSTLKDFREIINFIIESERTDNFVEECFDEIPPFDFRDEIENAIFKLRSHSEPLCESDGESKYSIGFESGLEMAATILENILKRSQEATSE